MQKTFICMLLLFFIYKEIPLNFLIYKNVLRAYDVSGAENPVKQVF